MICSDAHFRAIVEHLRTVAPPPRGCSVSVVRVDGLECPGYTSKHRQKFTIEIQRELCHMLTEWVLIHEWAHMLDWRPYHPLTGDHGATWGVIQARVYRAFYGVT
jgi:hypothetical protein